MEYKFNGKLTFDDFVQKNRFYMKDVFLKKKITIVLFIIVIIIFIGYLITNIILNNKVRFLEDISPILFFGLIMLFRLRMPKKYYKKYFENDKIIQEEQTFIINENEINISSENSFLKITKDKIIKIKYDKDSIYIYIGENKLCIIKSRYLRDLTEFNELRDFIKINYV
jgi:hypothetical protein